MNIIEDKLRHFIKNEKLEDITSFYRWTSQSHLEKSNNGKYLLEVRKEATEMVEDIYNQGHIIMAKNVGPGLAFTLSKNNSYASEDMVCVSIKLEDFLTQGGILYKDVSSHEEGSYFLMLQEGRLEVEKEY